MSESVVVSFPVGEELVEGFHELFDDGEVVDDPHVTLVYLGEVDQERLGEVASIVEEWAKEQGPIEAFIGGFGRFCFTNHEGGKDAVYLSVSSPLLPEARQALASALEAAGFSSPSEHGFSPHITLAYIPGDKESPVSKIENKVPLSFSSVSVNYGEDEFASFPLSSSSEMIREEDGKWVLYSKDEDKKLGTFDTKEEAEEREEQVQYFKHIEAMTTEKVVGIAIEALQELGLLDGRTSATRGQGGLETIKRKKEGDIFVSTKLAVLFRKLKALKSELDDAIMSLEDDSGQIKSRDPEMWRGISGELNEADRFLGSSLGDLARGTQKIQQALRKSKKV